MAFFPILRVKFGKVFVISVGFWKIDRIFRLNEKGFFNDYFSILIRSFLVCPSFSKRTIHCVIISFVLRNIIYALLTRIHYFVITHFFIMQNCFSLNKSGGKSLVSMKLFPSWSSQHVNKYIQNCTHRQPSFNRNSRNSLQFLCFTRFLKTEANKKIVHRETKENPYFIERFILNGSNYVLCDF